MNNVILYNPAIATSNVGDHIIFKYCKKAIRTVFQKEALTEFPTQMPVSRKMLRRFRGTKYRFVCGSNLLQPNMFFKLCRRGIATHALRQWDISLSMVKRVGPTILLGCGWQNYTTKTNWYTRRLWRKVLSKSYIHSVRDNFTLERLQALGITNVVNTGCPTTWALTPEFCREIPTHKANAVITTITDYRKDPVNDEAMLRVLTEHYETVWLWLQGAEDKAYFDTFSEDIKAKVILVPPQLESFDAILQDNEIDYVGTRLHGGIYALNQKKRTIIVGIDNRALEMQRDIHLKVVERGDTALLVDAITGTWSTDITIPQENINRFLQQFSE